MKKFLVLSLSVFCAVFLVACSSTGQVTVGPGNLHGSSQVHEWKGIAHSTTGDLSEWQSTTTVGFVTGTVGGGWGDCEGISASAGISWKDED